MRLVMCIPSYWSSPAGWRDGDVVFDHPTPLDQEGTLGRALASLSLLDDLDFSLVLVVAAARPELAVQARAKVARIASTCSLSTYLFGQEQLALLGELLTTTLSLDSYGQVRNLCLLAAQLLDADAVLMIDDDEVFTDPGFIEKVRQGLAGESLALAGFYTDARGSYQLVGEEAAWEHHLGKRAAMSQAFDLIIGQPPRYKPTPFAFGGNMAMRRELFQRVPFDPRITRGEDVDYVINARLAGVDFLLDNRLAVVHLPPPHSHAGWQRLEQDAVRFLYQREKVAAAGLEPASLDPYPGPFLRADLRARLLETCALLGAEYQRRSDVGAVRQVEALSARLAKLELPGALAAYRRFSATWQLLCERVSSASWRERVLASARLPD